LAAEAVESEKKNLSGYRYRGEPLPNFFNLAGWMISQKRSGFIPKE